MRQIIFLLLLTRPSFGHATVLAPVEGITASVEKANQKHGFLKRVTEKVLIKHLKKSMTSPQYSGGKRLAITGFVISALAFLLSIPPLSLALAFTFGGYFIGLVFLMGLTGLILCLKARRWENSRAINRLAIAGIVLGALVSFVGILILLALLL